MSYRLVIFLLWPVFFIYTLKIALRDKSRRYFYQRMGFAYSGSRAAKTEKTIWIHCASVGEVNTYMPLHRKLLELFPTKEFIITTNTTTGASTVVRHAAARTTHYYLPIESSFSIKRFLKTARPERCLIMETEIWPLLYQQCARQHIPITLINARLSHRTLQANRWIKGIYKTSLKKADKILCKSAEEVEHFKQLGATDNKLLNVGNLKFAPATDAANIHAIDLNSRNYVVAASTHNDEEKQLAQLWSEINTDTLLVIAPRHPNRSEQIQKQLAELSVPFAVRSKQQAINDDTQIYLADTLGELGAFMQGAEFVFIGGSLIPHGGQNILEPARLGKTTVCGPHMFNFKDEVDLLKDQHACFQVSDIDELKDTFIKLLQSPDKQTFGENARKALQQQENVLDNYLALLTGQ